MKYSDFTRLYSLSKTLRFGLIPVGDTLKNVIESDILKEDEQRAEDYVKVKNLIDEYHKAFIEDVLTDFHFPEEGDNSLKEYYALFQAKDKDEKAEKNFEKAQEKLRKLVVSAFTKDERFKSLDKKELIQQMIPEFLREKGAPEEDIALVQKFNDFTTYFTGFHQNRGNIYSEEAKATSIAHRIVHENLPKFLSNMKTFEIIKQEPEMQECLQQIEKEMGLDPSEWSLEHTFSLTGFNHVLSQKGIDTYNSLIGGRTEEQASSSTLKKIKGINEHINLFNQTHPQQRLPKLQFLFKQILSDRGTISWLPQTFDNDQQLLQAVEDAYQSLKENVLKEGNSNLVSLLASLKDYDLNGIHINNNLQLTDISQKMFGQWQFIQEAITADLSAQNPRKKKEQEEAYCERIQKELKRRKSFSIAYIDSCIRQKMDSMDADSKKDFLPSLEDYFKTMGQDRLNATSNNLLQKLECAHGAFKPLYDLSSEVKSLAADEGQTELVKNLLDVVMEWMHFVKPLRGNEDESLKDERFYGEFMPFWTELERIIPLYNMVRNHLTKKPFEVSKIKLNFKNSTLLDGWDKNKEKDNTSVLLRKDGFYYLAIMNKKFNKVFEDSQLRSDGECYEKLVYKLLPGPNKMLPKVFFPKKKAPVLPPSEEILRIKESGSFKKGDNFSVEDMHKLIDFYKQALDKHEEWRNFNFKFSPTESYKDMNGFFNEVLNQGYKIKFVPVSVAYIEQLVAEGKIYLFRLHNKDFSPASKGRPNLHTLYWKALFDERNLQDVVFKLNGQAELFYRKKSLPQKITHPANTPIKNKNKLNAKPVSVFTYDLIKDRRYTVDHFQFHVPITLNFGVQDQPNLNQKVNEFLRENPDVHLIGLDRGERHLLYLSIIDTKGNIIEQHSLNVIESGQSNQINKTDYHNLLDTRETERRQARVGWKQINSIKDLKEGYLSQVINIIAQHMLKHPSIVVLEDLNQGFMRGRQKVEKSVYQRFEKQLIDKLNYLVSKQADAEDVGGLFNALQLTNKAGDSFNGRQNGFLLYIPAWNTSKIDPVTGFVNFFDTRYTSIPQAQQFFNKFKDIRFNEDKQWFEFETDYSCFTAKAAASRKDWNICTYGPRIRTFRNPEHNNQWENETISLTNEFKRLFEEHQINFHTALKPQIVNQQSKNFFTKLLELFKLTLQMRNSEVNSEVDFIISPVANEQGVFFDSRTITDAKQGPENADANGAFNIARKGLLWLRQLIQAEEQSKFKADLSKDAWLKFVQEKPYLNE